MLSVQNLGPRQYMYISEESGDDVSHQAKEVTGGYKGF